MAQSRLEEEQRRDFESLKQDLQTRLEKTKSDAAKLPANSKLRQANGLIVFAAAIDNGI